MKLWLLYPRDDLPRWEPHNKVEPAQNPWVGSYDCAFGFVVRAENETEARRIAAGDAGAEKPVYDQDQYPNPWLTDRYSVCMELTPDGDAGLILQDFRAG